MKTIVIVRHAKSSWDNPSLKDVNRKLSKRGISDAPIMAAQLIKSGIKPDVLISSHAVRALKTAELFAETLSIDKETIIIEKQLYHGDIEEFINATMLIPESASTAVMFGHNPGITYFANVVCEANIENVPTCGVLVIQSKADTWMDTDISDLKLTNFFYPKK